ncbi:MULTISPECIES: hypothetical protein [Larsenimonas]|uniref:Uncharacterized protein n=1 Tax=Larsenimonas suaedae TaxID=1851019 RepID=A0ABU1GUF1_9GAMM|nr:MULTISPECIES: hypothetical protein [Larsenimonas]MCM2970905.1 hypothetical protein [Larsenimonas suaedae]MCM5703011.1 hypothetical protein [Larsenimonas salina]MDR5895614.1 hypothetical protein [Larsenimonas suaedae]
MADLPGFIAIEVGDEDLPVAIAWTLPDGQLKHTLIQPDPDWLQRSDASLGDYTEDELNMMGVSPIDVLRELEEDHYNETLYSNGLVDDEQALSWLFDEYGMDPFIQLAPADSLYEHLTLGEWHRQRNDLFNELGLEPFKPEDELQVMLTLHMRAQSEAEDQA